MGGGIMGGSKTKTVGGTPSAPLAKDFTSFLGNSLGQTGNFQNTLNSLLTGQGQTGYNEYLSSLQNNMGNIPQVNAQTVQPGQATASPITGSSVNPTTSNIDFSSLINQQYGVNQPDLNSILRPTNIQQQPQIDFSALANITGNQANLQPAPQQFAAPTADFNNPMVQALSQYANQNLNDNVNAIRERFTSGGGAGMGTPAAFAEALTRSRGTTDLTNALAQFAQTQQGVQQQNNALNSQNALAARGQDLQNYLGQQGINLSAIQSLQGNQLAQRGQDLSTQLQAAGIDAGTAQALANGLLQQGNQTLQGQQLAGNQQQTLAQLFGQQGQFNANATNTGQLANQQNALQVGQLNQGNDQAIQLANLQAALQAAMGNQSSNLAAQQSNLQGNLQGQNNQLNLAQLFGQSAGMTQQGQLSALQQLFNSFNQSNALGTPQAQTIQKPSGFQNAVGAITGLTNAASGIAGLF